MPPPAPTAHAGKVIANTARPLRPRGEQSTTFGKLREEYSIGYTKDSPKMRKFRGARANGAKPREITRKKCLSMKQRSK
jgi:hypothetical protein